MTSLHWASIALTLAAGATVLAAVAHFACIVVGPSAYRVMGAGDRAVRAVERGRVGPHIAAFAVGSLLLLVAAYALSGAGLLRPLPLLHWVLLAVALVLLARALLFPLLRGHFAGNSERFWVVSSLACFALGSLYLIGVLSLWRAS